MEVLYEDNHVIVVNKACNEIVQADKSGDKPLSEIVKEYLKAKYNKQGNVFIGVTHRIDRPVSGAVLFAKTSKALSRINEMFRTHTNLKKKYYAIVKNLPPERDMQVVHYLVRNEAKNRSYAYEKEIPNGKRSVLALKCLADSDNYHLLEVDLKTGRHHQIRCQLAKIGCPIKGDVKYGAARTNADGGISLHAHYLEFIHPVSKRLICIEAPLPHDVLWDSFSQMLNLGEKPVVTILDETE